MKVIAFVEIVFDDIEPQDEIIHSIKSGRYNIFNEDDLVNALNDMGKDIEITVAEKQIEKSGLSVKQIHKITIHYDKYDPTTKEISRTTRLDYETESLYQHKKRRWYVF